MRVRFCISLLCLAAVLCSCGSDDGVTTIRYWAFGGVPEQNQWVREEARRFNAEHPDINVVVSLKSWNMIRELLYVNFTSGTGPDVVRVHANYASEFGEGGFFYPVNEFADFDSVRSWYEPYAIESCSYNGNCYGLPSSALAFILACNRDLFDRYNLKPPKTWSEFREVARTLTRDTDNDGEPDQWGLVLMGGDRGGFAYRLAPFIYKAGGDILSKDLTTVRFNEPAAFSALQLFVDMFHKDRSITPGFCAYTHSEISDLFHNNKVGMSIEGPWIRNLIAAKSPDKDLYIVPIPVPDHLAHRYETMPTLQDVVMVAMNRNSEHPEAAWKWMKTIRSPEADMNWITSDFGGIAVAKKAVNSEEAKNVPDLDMFRHELVAARPWPSHPQMIWIVRNIMAVYGLKAINGAMDARKAWNEAMQKAQEVLDE
jgi:multiple sugar transport system substrate-binding protein